METLAENSPRFSLFDCGGLWFNFKRKEEEEQVQETKVVVPLTAYLTLE